MRSRFAAYALGLVDYLIETTHPLNPQFEPNKKSWKRALQRFCQETEFLKLEILREEAKDLSALVVFRVHLIQKGKKGSFEEGSLFEKKGGKWLYKAGLINPRRNIRLEDILPLAYYGNPILEKKGKRVEKIDASLKDFVRKMGETMDFYSGIGLAAPQVHASIQLFIIREPKEEESGEVHFGEIRVFINPTVKVLGETTWNHIEGCLSIPSIQAEVERPLAIEISYTDLSGKERKERAQGWKARVILHENDHIQGILFPDRLKEKERKEIAVHLEDLKKRSISTEP